MSDKAKKSPPCGKYAPPQPTTVKVPNTVSFDSAQTEPKTVSFDYARNDPSAPCAATKRPAEYFDNVADVKSFPTPIAAAVGQLKDSKLTSVAQVTTVDSAVGSMGDIPCCGMANLGQQNLAPLLADFNSLQLPSGEKTRESTLTFDSAVFSGMEDRSAKASLDTKKSGLERLTAFNRLPGSSEGKKQELTPIPSSTATGGTVFAGVSSAADEGISVTTLESAPSLFSAASAASSAPSSGFVPAAKVAAMADELRMYKSAVKKAVHCVAFTGNAVQAMCILVRSCPSVQLEPDCPKYQEIPLGQAALRGHVNWALEFLASADAATDRGLAGRVLSHRNSARHTLLMLAADLLDEAVNEGGDLKQREQLLVRMLQNRPSQVHECYDSEGRNVLHHCAADNRPAALRLILSWLAKNAPQCPGQVAAALRMPDGRGRTPIHYMAEVGSVAMLQVVADFAMDTGITVDYNWRWPVAFDHTPLMLAAAGGHADVCDWLLQQVIDASGAAGIRAAAQVALEAKHTSLAEKLLKSVQPTQRPASSEKNDAAAEDDCGFDESEEDDEEDEDETPEDSDKDQDEAGVSSVGESAVNSALPPPPPQKNDLSNLSSEARARLCSELRKASRYDEFLRLLKLRVPELTAKNPGFLELSTDPVFLSISLMAGRNMPEASCAMLASLLVEMGLPELAKELRLEPGAPKLSNELHLEPAT